MKPTAIKLLFVVAAVYDGVVGLLFLFVGARVFEQCGITPPNHFGYVQFPAALLLVFALMFLAIARDPRANRNLIPYGMLLKVAYCGVIFFYWITTDLPYIWKPFALADLVFLPLFLWAYLALTPPDTP